VIVVNSEFETTHVAAVPVVDTEHLRVWEVAGTPHGIVRRGGDRPDERGRVANRLSYAPVHDAALRALHRWLTDGVAAPAQPRIEVDAGPRATIRRDPSGNALGGIRLPEMDAPTHEYRGMAFGTGRAPLFGAARPFSDEELLARYPDRATFTRCWTAAVDRLVASGALLAEDADAMKRRAADAPLPVDPA
jgi:hypothetical protein